MNEWLNKMMAKAREFWKNASIVKKVILFAVIAAVIIVVTSFKGGIFANSSNKKLVLTGSLPPCL